ncbi:uncharacterized protein LOC141809064 isoform X2 [Halichoeres trimaculatus]
MSESLSGNYFGSSAEGLKLILLGNIGCGKTSSADNILGQVSPISISASRSCQLKQGVSEGRNLTLVEAPRWYWAGGKMEDSVRKETERALTLVAPGPHAFLLLVPVSQFTEMEGRVPEELEELFGEGALDHTLVLLTCGDYLMGRTEEEYLRKEHPGLRQMIEKCGGRYHVINNRQRQDRQQIQGLLEKVENMAQDKGIYRVKSLEEKQLEKRVSERRRELMDSYRAQKEERQAALSTRISSSISTTESSTERGEEYSSFLERQRREWSEDPDGRVSVRQVSNGLYSTPTPEDQPYSERYKERYMERELMKTPSFKLNADGAILSQMSDTNTSHKLVTTLHHRINSFEERSPEQSPTTSPRSPDFTFTSSSPVFTSSSSSSFPSSSSSDPSFPSSSSTSFSTSSSTSFPTSSSTLFPTSSSSSLFSSSSSSSTSFSTSSSTSFPTTSCSSFPTSSSSSSSSSFPPRSSSSSSSSSFPSSSQSSKELRLVLLGRSGSGKSAAGNSILGREEFASRPESLTPITRECEKKRALVERRQVAVVDTPDWFNSEQTPDEVRAQISSCVALSSPGPHAFLLCVPIDLPAKTELQALGALESVFGPEAVQKHTMVLFTYADRLRKSGKAGDGSAEAYISGQREDLLKIVEKCGDRFHVLETGGGWRDRRNVAELLDKVEQTVSEAGGQCYSCPAFQEAEKKVRQRQMEIARERKRELVRQFSSERRALYSSMQPVAEAEEEVREDEIEKTRSEAEMSVSTMNIESLPPVTLSTISPSLLHSFMEKMSANAKMLPKLLSDGSVWVGEGAKKVRSSPVWGTMGSRAQDVQKMVADSSLWQKVGSSAGQVSKMVGDRVPKVVVDSSAWVGSGAKAAAGSPVWGKVGSGAKSGAKIVADSSMRLGSGIGAGAKNLAKSPMWGKVGSGAKSGAKLMADGSMKVGAGLGAGAKKVAQSPVWGKMGSGAKAGVKMVAESSVWERMGNTAKQVPKVVIAGALLGLVLGVILAGAIGGAVGAAAGSAVGEVGRRKLSNKDASVDVGEAAKSWERTVNDNMDSLVNQGGKVLKTE